ncbi:Zinc finger protein [Aphelenchoides bicaudatus]|nr:Zinc finger protein [Aphelenchoides bicaudatus]
MQEECASVESESMISTPDVGSPSKPQSAENGGFACNLCDRKFADRDQLNVPPLCDLEFSIKRDKQTHMRIHAGEMPQKCNECGKEFGTRQLLKKHQMWHTGKRSHVCQECGKAFFQRGHLSQHYQIHKNERPYGCHLCAKTFIFRFDLNRHLKIHSERGRSFVCRLCSKSFSSASLLDSHNCKKQSPRKSIAKLASSPLSNFSQTETTSSNSPSTISHQSPSMLTAPLSPSDVKKEQPQIAELQNQNILRMAQLLMAQAQQRNLLNAATQNFFVQQQQVGAASTNAPLNLNGFNPLQLPMLLQHYRQQQPVQPNFHCSICAINFDNQSAYLLHCSRTHLNNGQQNLVPSPATAEQIMPSSQPEIQQAVVSTGLLAQMLNQPKEEQYENTSSSCASSPQKVSPALTQPLINSEWLSTGMPNCLRNHSNSPPCDKCVEYQSKYTELERNYTQTRSELSQLKEIVERFSTVSNLLNLQRAAN